MPVLSCRCCLTVKPPGFLECKMPSENNPWFKCFTQTYLRDDELKAVSFAAEGLHARMMNLCWLSEEPGYLTKNGRPMTSSDFALEKFGSRYTPDDVSEIQLLITELADRKRIVWCEHRKCFYVPKQKRQAEEQRRYSDFGKKGGGNPRLRAG